MHRTLSLALALTLATSAYAQEAAPSKVEQAVAPVIDAIRRAQADEAKLPPAGTTREKLERLGRLDQSGRMHVMAAPWATLSPEEGLAARKRIAEVMEPVDEANLAELRKIMPAEGWFSREEVGDEGLEAAFHIVQHSDLATLNFVLPRLQAAVARGDVDGFSYAAMFDRVATKEGRPQRYGTQFHCVAGRQAAYPLEDRAKVEEHRRAMKLPDTFADSEKRQTGRPCA